MSSPLAGVRRVLHAHAHPDDETLATGVLIAELSARGVQQSLLTATRGEQGEVVEGPLRHLMGTDELTAVREGELAGAIAELGLTEHVFLGTPPARAVGRAPRRYVDSGMQWVTETVAGPAPDSGPDAFTSADPAEAAADLSALLEALRPDLVITYDELGGYRHPDHVRMHEVAVRACTATGVRLAVVRSDDTPPQEHDEVFELGHRLGQVVAALGHHRTQLSVVDGVDVVHSGGQRAPIVTSVALRELPLR